MMLAGLVRRWWFVTEHKIHWLRHRELHRLHCTCQGTGEYT